MKTKNGIRYLDLIFRVFSVRDYRVGKEGRALVMAVVYV